jgi:hypothetical protein
MHDQFVSDLRYFLDKEVFGSDLEFRINDGHGGYTVFLATVVWDEDSVKTQPAVTIHGFFMGDVKLFIRRSNLPRAPVAGELIYSPANQPFEVNKTTIAEGLYEVDLTAHRSQPTMYGNN